MPPKKATITTQGTRRSARVASTSASAAAKEAALENGAAGKKRREDTESADENESNDGEGTERPKAKKLKATSKARATAIKKEDPPSGLQIGDIIPDTTLKNEKEEDVDVKQLAENGLVIFVIPKAATSSCTSQACAFRDAYAEFSKEGYAVFCLSNDKSGAQAKWQTKKELPYSLLSDPTRAFISVIGAGSATKTIRSHFIFEKGTGKLIDKKVPVSAKLSSQLALEFLQNLKGEASEE